MSKTATPAGPAGNFATSRRGGLTPAEIRLAQDLRSGERPVSWQNIANRLGRCEIDVRAMFADPEPEAPAEVAPKGFQWGPAQTAYLKARYRIDGPDAIAKVLGCTSSAASKKANRLGVSQPPGWNRKRPALARAA